jgi:hypothetical protein
LRGEAAVLGWRWERPLAENEYFDVRLWQEGQPPQGIAWATANRYEVRALSGGEYWWSIVVIVHTRTRADGTKEWQPASAESEVRRFFYSPPSSGGPVEADTPVPEPPTATPAPTSAPTEQPKASRTPVKYTLTPKPSPTRVPPTRTPPPSPPPPGTKIPPRV